MVQKRKQSTFDRLKNVRRIQSDDPGLEIIHQNVAGIDIGNTTHFVAVPPGRDPQPVQEFGSWQGDLNRMADWLEACGVREVVMQSTGVYWFCVREILEERGFKVCVTNARETRNLPGRKSDVQECQWLRKLHIYGLLRDSFFPPEEIRRVRTIWRGRDRHVEEAARKIQHLQKALTLMNVQLANTISDVSGVTGQNIIRAILKGERDPYKLAEMKDYRIKASLDEIAHSLEGNWQEDVLFELRQAVDGYDFIQRQIGECDRELEKYMAVLPDRQAEGETEPGTSAEPEGEQANAPEAGVQGKPGPGKKKKRKRKTPRGNEPAFNLEAELTRIRGVNPTAIDGVGVMTVQTFVSELGTDMSRWESEDHPVSWLKLAPIRNVSGGKVIRHERRKVKNRVADALRMSASSLEHSDSYLGAKFRHLKGRLGPRKAIKAMAARLARLMYGMLKYGKEYVDRGAREHESSRGEREKQQLARKAAALGFRLEPAA